MAGGRVYSEDIWNGHFQSLKNVLQARGGEYPVTGSSSEEQKVMMWVCKQRWRGKSGRLTARRIALLDSVNFDWGVERSSIRPLDGNDSVGVGDEPPGAAAAAAAVQQSTDSDSVKPAARKSLSNSRFNVSLPEYYKEICPPSSNDGTFGGYKMGQSDGTSNDHNKEEVTNDPNSIDSTEGRIKQHNDFIAALEKFGSENGSLAWNAMASSLKWPIEDVKVYAFSYFKSLTEGELKPCVSNSSRHREASTRAANAEQSSWTFDELVLLDSLMLKHCNSLDDLKEAHKDNSQGSSYLIRSASVWEKIAANLPGKTSEECYKMGVSRSCDHRGNQRGETLATITTSKNRLAKFSSTII